MTLLTQLYVARDEVFYEYFVIASYITKMEPKNDLSTRLNSSLRLLL